MKARLTFLSGPERGRRFVVDDGGITFSGDSSPTEHGPDAAAHSPIAALAKADGGYTIVAPHPPALLTVNGVDAGDGRARLLRDGDLIEIGGRQTIRFGTVPDQDGPAKPMRQIARQSWNAARHLQAGAARRGLFFLRDLCHCTASDASVGTRLGGAAIVVALTLAFGLGGLSLIQARAAGRRVVALGAQVAAGSVVSREHLEEQVARLGQLEDEKAAAEARLRDVSRHLETAEERLAKLERQTPDLQAAIETARRSVALIVVAYALYDKDTGNPLRFQTVDAKGVPQKERGTYATSTAGTGPMVTVYATGSGFVIERNRLVTNRHVVEPWREDASIQAVLSRGLEPRRTVAHAYFPGRKRAVALRVTAVSKVADIAVMTGTLPNELPVLTTAPAERSVTTGDLIFVVGYPTGFDALLAKADHGVAEQIAVDGTGEDPVALANTLAQRGLISPLVTVGHVGDVLTNNIVYDAATTYGSSGGPVLNARGEVVALNYAALEDFAGARFGIPIAMVQRLLQPPRPRAGSGG